MFMPTSGDESYLHMSKSRTPQPLPCSLLTFLLVRYNSASYVFTETYNGSGFTSVSYVAVIGLITSMYGWTS